MIKSDFDPRKPLQCVTYARMSDENQQNARSPQQQRDTITGTLRRCGYSWPLLTDYQDSGIKGRYQRKRPGLQRLLRDIRSGTLAVDAILVDTYERFGRLEQLQVLRTELYQKHGVLI